MLTHVFNNVIEKSKLLQGRFEVFIFPFSQGIFKKKKVDHLKINQRLQKNIVHSPFIIIKEKTSVEETEALNVVFQTSTG